MEGLIIGKDKDKRLTKLDKIRGGNFVIHASKYVSKRSNVLSHLEKIPSMTLTPDGFVVTFRFKETFHLSQFLTYFIAKIYAFQH